MCVKTATLYESTQKCPHFRRSKYLVFNVMSTAFKKSVWCCQPRGTVHSSIWQNWKVADVRWPSKAFEGHCNFYITGRCIQNQKMERIGQNQRRCISFRHVAAPGAKFAVYDCLVSSVAVTLLLWRGSTILTLLHLIQVLQCQQWN